MLLYLHKLFKIDAFYDFITHHTAIMKYCINLISLLDQDNEKLAYFLDFSYAINFGPTCPTNGKEKMCSNYFSKRRIFKMKNIQKIKLTLLYRFESDQVKA